MASTKRSKSAAAGDAITVDSTAYTVRVIQPEGSQVRLEDGSPASPVEEFIDVIVKEVETAKQSNSQGATDADVPAKEGQAKEGAWELFTG